MITTSAALLMTYHEHCSAQSILLVMILLGLLWNDQYLKDLQPFVNHESDSLATGTCVLNAIMNTNEPGLGQNKKEGSLDEPHA